MTVVGGGPVGLFAAFYAGLRGMSCRIVDSLEQLGGQLVALYPEKYVYDVGGFDKVLAKDLAAGFVRQGLQFGAETRLGVTADGLEKDADGWTLRTDGGEALPTRTVVVTAGAGAFTPTRLGAEGEEDFLGKGLEYGVREPESLAGLDVAVVGGGDSALDWAVHLAPIARSVRLVHRRDEFRAHEETVRTAHGCGVRFDLWKAVARVEGAGRVERLVLRDLKEGGETAAPCDAVVVCVGYKSSLGPIKEWGLEIEKNQIVVDHLQRTNLPRVFAAGDVCIREGKLKLIATGVGEAATAVCVAKTELDPEARLFPGHSSDADLGSLRR